MSQPYNNHVNPEDYYQPPSKRKQQIYNSLPLSKQDVIIEPASVKRKSIYSKFKNWIIFLLLIYAIFFRLEVRVNECGEEFECKEIRSNLFKELNKKLFPKPHYPPFFRPSGTDSFDLLKPDYTSSHLDNLVFTHYLLDQEEFAHTWGQVYTKKFNPSDIRKDFNSIEMTLTVSVNGTQFDRLINIYLNDITIWRSSTIEPLNRKTTKSHVTKNISKYISLFKDNNEEIELKFQLDNLIAGKLDGVFLIDLRIDYYNNAENSNQEEVVDLTVFEKALLNSLNPYSSPDSLKPLFKEKKISAKYPLVYYPLTSNKMLPYKIKNMEINPSTNKLAIELFISANAAEEFWYSNVLDDYSRKFDDKGFNTLGHGPVRFLNVYLRNDKESTKIFNSIPIPVVFTGGFAPSLWKPVVSIGCFDLKGIYIDVSPYLQLLRQDGYFLEFEVVSSNSEEYDKGIGNNWIVSGNLLEWANSDITFNNYIEDLPSVDEYTASARDGEDFLKQNVSALSILNKQFGFEFGGKDYFLQVSTRNELVSNISLQNYGTNESSLLSILSLRKYTVIEKDTEKEVIMGSDITRYGFIERLDSIEPSEKSIDLIYLTNAVTAYSRSVRLENFEENKKQTILKVSASQSGDATYNISTALGNHGTGSSSHSISLHRTWPLKDKYSRSVIVKDNKVEIDVIND